MNPLLRADQLRRAIAAATQRLTELEVETGQILARIDALHADLTADVVAAAPQFVQPTRDPSTSGQR